MDSADALADNSAAMIDRSLFAERVLAALKASGMSGNRVARELGLNRGYFYDMKIGKGGAPSVETAAKLVDYFHLDLEWRDLLDAEPDPTPGSRMKLWREYLGKSVAEAASVLGLTEAELEGYERGDPVPQDVLMRCGIRLDASVDYLLRGHLGAADPAFRKWLSGPQVRPDCKGTGTDKRPDRGTSGRV